MNCQHQEKSWLTPRQKRPNHYRCCQPRCVWHWVQPTATGESKLYILTSNRHVDMWYFTLSCPQANNWVFLNCKNIFLQVKPSSKFVFPLIHHLYLKCTSYWNTAMWVYTFSFPHILYLFNCYKQMLQLSKCCFEATTIILVER